MTTFMAREYATSLRQTWKNRSRTEPYGEDERLRKAAVKGVLDKLKPVTYAAGSTRWIKRAEDRTGNVTRVERALGGGKAKETETYIAPALARPLDSPYTRPLGCRHHRLLDSPYPRLHGLRSSPLLRIELTLASSASGAPTPLTPILPPPGLPMSPPPAEKRSPPPQMLPPSLPENSPPFLPAKSPSLPPEKPPPTQITNEPGLKAPDNRKRQPQQPYSEVLEARQRRFGE